MKKLPVPSCPFHQEKLTYFNEEQKTFKNSPLLYRKVMEHSEKKRKGDCNGFLLIVANNKFKYSIPFYLF